MKRKIQFFLLLLTLLVIWGHSLMPGNLSSAESGGVLEWLYTRFGWRVPELLVRKAAHFLEFALLGAQLRLLYRGSSWREVLRAAALGGGVALLDETLQLFPPGREGKLPDVWLDLAGAALGAAVAQGILPLLAQKGKNRQKSRLSGSNALDRPMFICNNQTGPKKAIQEETEHEQK